MLVSDLFATFKLYQSLFGHALILLGQVRKVFWGLALQCPAE